VNLRVLLEFDDEANAWSAVCPELPGCASAGDTKEEALANIREAIEVYLSPDEPAPDNAMVVELTV
jgi:predicted RNase H-like HicB family nuclease